MIVSWSVYWQDFHEATSVLVKCLPLPRHQPALQQLSENSEKTKGASRSYRLQKNVSFSRFDNFEKFVDIKHA